MRNLARNYLQLTIHQTRIISPTYFDKTFSMKIKVLEQSLISDKITGKFFDYNKSFFFDVPPDTQIANFEITANIKSFLFFDTEIGKLDLNLNLNKLLEKSQWYSIKNNQNEIVLMVFISFAFDGATIEKESSPIKKGSRNSENMSFDKIKVHLNKSIISNTIDDLGDRNGQNNSHIVNISHLDLNNISHISKVNGSSSKKAHFPNAQSGAFSNGHGDLSRISIFSNSNNLTHHHQNSNPSNDLKKFKPGDNSEYISTLDSILEADEENKEKRFNNQNYNDLKKKFIAKFNNLKEKKEKLNKFIDELRVAKDKLRQKENIIKKERDLYEAQLKQMQQDKNHNHQYYQQVNYKFKRLQDNREEEMHKLFDYDKELFFNLNFLVNIPNNIESKLQDLNHHFAMLSISKYSNNRHDNNNIVAENFSQKKLDSTAISSKHFSITFPQTEENSLSANKNASLVKSNSKEICKITSSHYQSPLILNTSADKDLETSQISSKLGNSSINVTKLSKKPEGVNPTNTKFHPMTAKIDLILEENGSVNKSKVNQSIIQNSVSSTEIKESASKQILVDFKVGKDRYVSGSAEKTKKSIDITKNTPSTVKKDSNNNLQIKKPTAGGNINIAVKKSPKVHEVSNPLNKQQSGKGKKLIK